jgi:hypothetical protein
MKDKTGHTILLQHVSYCLNTTRVSWHYRRHGTHVLTNILINYSDGELTNAYYAWGGGLSKGPRE